jgi:predicted DsbA family dithiol-disulfide isomerase
LEKLETTHPVDVVWRSFELRPQGSPPIPAEYRAKIEEGRPRLHAVAREQYGVEMNQGPFGIDSRPALIGAKFAEAEGHGPAYHRAVMDAYWVAGRDIGDVEVLVELAVAVGLDEAAYRAALQAARYDAEVQADVELAREYGLNGVPALVFADRYLISGAQPYPVLAQATEQVLGEMGKGDS